MNANPHDTHLDLDDLIAIAAGQPAAGQQISAPGHLARCEHCQRELNRWNLVADGVRGLAAAAPETAQPTGPRRTSARPGPWRRVMLVAGSAAAALVLLLGLGTAAGFVHVHVSGSGSGTVLTAVNGCFQLQQADGTLAQVTGSSLVVRTAGGQPATVTTTPATFVSMSGNLLGDITDGASVLVRGNIFDGTIQATVVSIRQPVTAVNHSGFVSVQGTVADAGADGFTVVTSSGTRTPVTTSRNTLVLISHPSLSQLPAGAAIFALGQAGPNGTLSARAVAAVSQMPSGAQIHVSVKDCSPTSILAALSKLSAGRTSARS